MNRSPKKQKQLVTTTRPHKSYASRARARRLARWQAVFLKTLRSVPNITLACKAAHVSRRTVYDHRENDPAFREAFEDALNQSVDVVETTAFKLASEGEPRLIEFILKAHKSSVYGDRARLEIDQLCGVILLPQRESLPP